VKSECKQVVRQMISNNHSHLLLNNVQLLCKCNIILLSFDEFEEIRGDQHAKYPVDWQGIKFQKLTLQRSMYTSEAASFRMVGGGLSLFPAAKNLSYC